MTVQNQQQLGKILWAIADKLRGPMNADDFRPPDGALGSTKGAMPYQPGATPQEMDRDTERRAESPTYLPP